MKPRNDVVEETTEERKKLQCAALSTGKCGSNVRINNLPSPVRLVAKKSQSIALANSCRLSPASPPWRMESACGPRHEDGLRRTPLRR